MKAKIGKNVKTGMRPKIGCGGKHLLAAVLLALLMLMPAQTAMAEPVQYQKWTKTYAVSVITPVYFKLKENVISVKSSNKSVAKISKYGKKTVVVKPKKTGTTKLTVRAGRKTYTCKFKVVKYKNPFKELSIAETNVASDYKTYNPKYSPVLELDRGEEGPVVVVCRDGFVLKRMTLDGVKIKNNKKITIEKDMKLEVSVLNEKRQSVERFGLSLKAAAATAENDFTE